MTHLGTIQRRLYVYRVCMACAVCTATWLNMTNIHSFGSTQHKDGVTSSGDCLDFCARTTTCVAVEVDYEYWPVHCWVYYDASKLQYTMPLNNVIQYRVLSRVCRNITCRLCLLFATFLCRPFISK